MLVIYLCIYFHLPAQPVINLTAHSITRFGEGGPAQPTLVQEAFVHRQDKLLSRIWNPKEVGLLASLWFYLISYDLCVHILYLSICHPVPLPLSLSLSLCLSVSVSVCLSLYYYCSFTYRPILTQFAGKGNKLPATSLTTTPFRSSSFMGPGISSSSKSTRLSRSILLVVPCLMPW